MGDPMLETNLRGMGAERRVSEPRVTVSWGSLQVTVTPKVTPGVGWSETELEANLSQMWTAGFTACNVESIDLPTIDDAVDFMHRLIVTCELPEQWVDEAAEGRTE